MFSENLYFTNETGKRLYNEYAKDLPIIDYHCHLVPKEIDENKVFEDLGEMWLAHDHYKWRAMRTFGIAEELITGDSTSFYEKFLAFAEIYPLLIGNPLYIWCALELKRFFCIDEPLSKESADRIYKQTKKFIEDEKMTPIKCMEMSKVEFVATTDDPIDDLQYHKNIATKDNGIKVVASFRADKVFYIENDTFVGYLAELGKVTDTKIEKFSDVINAIDNRLKYFSQIGSNISDSGITYFKWEDYTDDEVDEIVEKALKGLKLSKIEIDKYKTCYLVNYAQTLYDNNFVMQIHFGTIKNSSTTMYKKLGADTGFDCSGDDTSVNDMAKLFDRIELNGKFPRIIVYPLDINKFENFGILCAGFCGGGVKSRVIMGVPWWFADQAYGIHKQLESLGNLYPVALTVGMLTDSRSFLSYPRHEVFRRVYCNYLGMLIERAEYFGTEENIKEIVENVCYYNAKEYFNV
ncbi:MAG: glucuronate isomerase [Lachnospirales bacterium]